MCPTFAFPPYINLQRTLSCEKGCVCVCEGVVLNEYGDMQSKAYSQSISI